MLLFVNSIQVDYGNTENRSLWLCKAVEYINIQIHILVYSLVYIRSFSLIKCIFNAHIGILWIPVINIIIRINKVKTILRLLDKLFSSAPVINRVIEHLNYAFSCPPNTRVLDNSVEHA
jgi:hypothetical protein